MINIKDINYVPNISEISVYIENSAFDELYQHMNNEYKAVCKIEYSKDVWARGWKVKFKKIWEIIVCCLSEEELLYCIGGCR